MNMWLFIVGALFLQEPASTDAAIFLIRQNSINLILINGIWLTATIIDIWIGYKIGKWVQTRFHRSRLINWSERFARKIEGFVGRSGEATALILLGVINFPYANTFFASWLSLSFKKVFLYIFIGDTIYWVSEWFINIVVRNNVSNSHTALYLIVGIGLLLSVLSKTVLTKILR